MFTKKTKNGKVYRLQTYTRKSHKNNIWNRKFELLNSKITLSNECNPKTKNKFEFMEWNLRLQSVFVAPQNSFRQIHMFLLASKMHKRNEK